ncbi:cellulose biosynthesis regulator YedQ [Cupriavidus numazuensis]|uniref:diguanylate cyclase n=1 Tax=Cupriavidus numazuensis TaxID=221992 RepID=A0ABN7PU43_9BURK|nr:cellulose biosynthesis regulator YedQ [Cupriavidus numazuensis]CAG2138386.1 putative diguanylate cyclase DgcQ [Cupriavidus numazuensis]
MWRRSLPQPRWLPRLAVMRPHRVVVGCFAVVLLLALVVGLRDVSLVRERDLRARQHNLELRALGVEAVLEGERRRLQYLSTYAERLFEIQASADAVPPDAAIRQAYAQRNAPVWQMKLPLDGPALIGVGPAGLTGLRSFDRRDPDLMVDLYVGRMISELLGLSIRADHVQGNAIFISSNGFFVAYPGIDPAMAVSMMQRFDSMPYYRGQTPEVNPGRELYWVPMYDDFQSKRRMTTLSVPIYAGQQFRGVVAIDVEQKRLDELLRAASDPGTVQYMMNAHGDVLAISDDPVRKVQKWPDAVPGNWKDFAPADLFARGSGMVKHDGDYLLFHRAPQSPWLLMDVVPARELYASMFASMSRPLLMIWVLLPLLLWITLKVVTQLFDHYIALGEKLQEIARQDPLTGLSNRRRMRELAQYEFERQKRDGQPLALVMIDIDFFKKVNDHWGHASGDKVLVELARTMRANLRNVDQPARLGGEEFAVLMPNTSLAEAAQSAERLRRAIAACVVEADPEARVEPADRIIRFTISVGVAEAPAEVADGVPMTLDGLAAIADRRLYDAKTQGRNRVVSDDSAHAATVPQVQA